MEEQESEKTKEVVKLTKIEEAKLLVERLEKANAEHRLLLEREEMIKAEKMVSGEAMAGQEKKAESLDEKWEREAKIRYAGTGMDPTSR